MYMANVSPNGRGPNVTYITPAHIGLALGLWGLAFGQECFALGPQGFMLGLRGFPDTNMLVSTTGFGHVGSGPEHEAPTRVVCVAVEYRVYVLNSFME